MNRLQLLSIILILGIATTGCVNRGAQAEAAKTKEILSDVSVPVGITTLAESTFVEGLDITGALSSSEDVTIGAKMTGRLIAVYVKDGDSVTSGQLLAKQETVEFDARLNQARAQEQSAVSQLKQAISDAEEAPKRSNANVRAARAQLAQAEAQLLKAKNGARAEEKRQASASLASAKVNLEVAQKDYNRGKILLDEGAISERDFDRYRQALAQAQANYEGAVESLKIVNNATRAEDISSLHASVNAAREQLQSALSSQRLDVTFRDRVDSARSQVDSARENVNIALMALEDTKIFAPFSGKVAGKPAALGTAMGPGVPVLRMVGNSGIYFEGEIPDNRVNSVKPGMSVTVKVDAIANRTMTGTIATISPSAESLGRLYKVRIQLDGFPTEIKAGMFARGTIELSRTEGIVIAKNTIKGSGTDQFVYLVQDGKAKKQLVKITGERGTRAMVSGLQSGDQLIVEGQNIVTDGTPVKLKPNATASEQDSVTTGS
jgi:RND family efflux transporter MFP subunit